ncbi:uncharacterized protein PG998_014775 [Apiospora kogelbergensis]|uniref:uncharacterized protein n=1 Tax=Apiospora kogelbergensis TaxID=1337665 RepID=UPI0031312000
MASTCSFSSDDAKQSIKKSGVYVVEDNDTGNSVVAFEKRLPFKAPEGLDFCAQNSLLNKDVRTVIESSITRPSWGLAKIYRGDVLPSDQAYFFFDGPDMQVVLVLLWAPGAQFLIFEGSHNKQLLGKSMSDFGIMSLPRDKLIREGITEVSREMDRGGFALIDGRVGWTIIKGYTIAIGYASEAEISHWGKIKLKESEPLRRKVKELNMSGIKTNFVFIDASEERP